jgi:hypothetical protein
MKFVCLWKWLVRGARFIWKMIRNNNKLGLTLREERGMGVSENRVVRRSRYWTKKKEDDGINSVMWSFTSALSTIHVE